MMMGGGGSSQRVTVVDCRKDDDTTTIEPNSFSTLATSTVVDNGNLVSTNSVSTLEKVVVDDAKEVDDNRSTVCKSVEDISIKVN